MLTRCTRVLVAEHSPASAATDPTGQRSMRRFLAAVSPKKAQRGIRPAQASMEVRRGRRASLESNESALSVDARTYSIPVKSMQAMVMRLHQTFGFEDAQSPLQTPAAASSPTLVTPTAVLDNRFQQVQDLPLESPESTPSAQETSPSPKKGILVPVSINSANISIAH